MIRIKSATVESIIDSARNVYPNEFIALIGDGDNDKVIDELVMVPSVYGRDFSSMQMHLVPFDKSILGSVHSHPGRYNRPSKGDLMAFGSFGDIHFIISYPFNLGSLRAFNLKGKELEYEVVD